MTSLAIPADFETFIASDYCLRVADACHYFGTDPIYFVSLLSPDPWIQFTIVEAMMIRHRAWIADMEAEAEKEAAKAHSKQERRENSKRGQRTGRVSLAGVPSE